MKAIAENPEPIAPKVSFRFAEARDSAEFSKWALENDKIPRKDILATLKDNNPTTVTFVIENEGVPVLFAPVYCLMNLAYLGFNPEAAAKDRLQALEALQAVLSSFAIKHGVHEITVQTSKDYPVAQWALKHEFNEEPRTTFKYRVTPLINPMEGHENDPVEK